VAFAVGPPVVENDADLPVRDQVPVGLELVHAPAFDPPRADHDLVAINDGLTPELVTHVEERNEGAAVIGKRRQALQDEALDPFVELVPVGVDRRLIAPRHRPQIVADDARARAVLHRSSLRALAFTHVPGPSADSRSGRPRR
jgi:hypothetical protein